MAMMHPLNMQFVLSGTIHGGAVIIYHSLQSQDFIAVPGCMQYNHAILLATLLAVEAELKKNVLMSTISFPQSYASCDCIR